MTQNDGQNTGKGSEPKDLFFNYMGQLISMNAEELRIIEEHWELYEVNKGEMLVEVGKANRYNYFVLEGCVRQFYVDKEGSEHITQFSPEGWWAGELGSFLDRTTAQSSVQCLERTRVLRWSLKQVDQLIKEVPKFQTFLKRSTERVLVTMVNDSNRSLDSSAAQRYALFKEKYPGLEARVPQYMIASYLGITKEFFSKMKKELLTGG